MSILKKIEVFFMAMLCFLFASGCSEQKKPDMKTAKVKEMDLSLYRESKPAKMMRLLFIHHSCGGLWLADKGEAREIVPNTCLFDFHPEGGGLRTMLMRNNYEVHEAGYNSLIGDKTDVCDWNMKFRDKMDDILRCDRQDLLYTDPSKKNDIVMFKSCFPANAIEAEGEEPGNPDSPEKTMANYKAAYTKLLDYFRAQPNTLFVCVTAPPLIEKYAGRFAELKSKFFAPERGAKAVGERARSFNNWLKDAENGWLAGYKLKNVVVFDLYDVLTGNGVSNYAIYPTDNGRDSHPSAEGNAIAAREFVPFLNRAVNRFLESQTDLR